MQIYVSSTFADMRPYREVAYKTLDRLGIRATGVEYWSASEVLPVERSLQAVRVADAVVLVVGHRYGFVPEGHDKSMAQLEYEEAVRFSKPVFAFLLSEDTPVRPQDIERDPELIRRLNAFRSELRRSVIVGTIVSTDDFGVQLVTALISWLQEAKAELTHTEAKSHTIELEREIERQKDVISELQDRLTRIVPSNPIWRGRNFAMDGLSCFVLMPFQDRFFETYEAAIVPAVSRCGLTPKHAGEIFGNSEVIEDIWDSICSARVIVVDVTGRNANVFYELGICHTLGKECVVITQTDADVPFDIRHRRFLRYDPTKTNLLTSNLERTIRAVLTKAGSDIVGA